MERFWVALALALVLGVPCTSSAQPLERRWTSLDLVDVDPAPFAWSGPCEVLPAASGATQCKTTLRPGGNALFLSWHETEAGDCRSRPCSDGLLKVLQVNPNPGQLFAPSYSLRSKRYSAAAVYLGSGSGTEEAVFRRIFPLLVRLVEPYAVPCGCPGERPGVVPSGPPRPPGSDEPSEPLDIPVGAGVVDEREGYDQEGGVFGQPDDGVAPAPPRPSPEPEVDITFGSGAEAFDAGDFERSLELLTAAAEAGHPRAPGFVGHQYELGKGTAPDPTEALRYYRMGAQRKDGFATYQLGIAHERGNLGVSPEDRSALEHYRRAAAQGWGDAARTVGMSYQQGFGGVEPDDRLALEYYLEAVELGNVEALNDAGVFVQEGRGGASPDPERAAAYFRRGADQGDAAAMHSLGRAYLLGLGVALDREQAAYWYGRASDLGYEVSTEALKKMEAGEW